MAITDTVGEYLPSFTGGGIGTMVTFLAIVLLFAVVGGAIAYFVINAIKYNRKITILENVNGVTVPVGKDRAKVVKVSDAGEEVLYLKKRKLYKGAYGKKIGKNHYAFLVGQDGYWYNVTFGNFDETRKELKMFPVDRDMRYAHEGIRKNIAMRFDSKNWLKDNIGVIFGVVSIVLVLIFMWLIADKYFSVLGGADAILKSTEQSTTAILDKAGQLLSAIDNVCTGGSGIALET